MLKVRVQTKLTLLLGLVTIVFMVVLVSLQQSLLTQMDLLVRDRVKEQQVLFDKIVELKGAAVATLAFDYTYWDEMVRFVRDGNRTWAAENIEAGLPTYKCQAAWVFRPDRSLVYSHNTLGNSSLKAVPIPAEALPRVMAPKVFRHFFVNTSSGIVEIRSAPIQPSADSERRTPPQGYFLVGRVWSKDYIGELSHLSDAVISVVPGKADSLPPSRTDTKTGLITFARDLPGWDEKPIAYLKIRNESPVIAQFSDASDRNMVMMATFCLILLILLIISLRRWVSAPLQKIQGCLDTEDPQLMGSLVHDNTEFGQLASLIQRFFAQRSDLVNEVAERRRVEEALRETRDQLEVRVTERTAELARANEDLRHEMDERQRLEQQLLQAQKMESIGTLAGGIAHDFNNILTGIIGFADLAVRELHPSSPAYPFVSGIPAQGKRASDLIRQLLTFSRRGVTNRAPLNLVPLVKETVAILKRTLPANINVQLICADSVATVKADVTQMQQIIMNLATNARDAMPKGGNLTMEVRRVTLDEDYCRSHAYATPGDNVCLIVRDNGTGMSEEVQQRIFEPFFTTKDIGKGTGLGMSMVYGIVKSHEGHINLKSAPGEGTEFGIYLAALEQESQEVADSERTDVSGGAETILLVEDESTVRQVETALLESLGHKVLTAVDGADAFDVFLRHRDEITLVFTDMMMPRMDGKALLEELIRAKTDVKVVLVSGYGLSEDVAELRSLGFCAFLQKPFTIAEVGRAVREALDGGA